MMAAADLRQGVLIVTIDVGKYLGLKGFEIRELIPFVVKYSDIASKAVASEAREASATKLDLG